MCVAMTADKAIYGKLFRTFNDGQNTVKVPPSANTGKGAALESVLSGTTIKNAKNPTDFVSLLPHQSLSTPERRVVSIGEWCLPDRPAVGKDRSPG